MRALFLVLVACAGDPATLPVEPLLSDYVLSDAVDYPEGMAFRADERAFYVGSLGHGGITRVDADGTETLVFAPDEDGWATLGLKIHPDTGDVLACAVRDPSTPDAVSELWVLDPATAAVQAFPLAGAPANCNDVVAVGDQVYLTDREAPRLHRVDLATGTASVFLEHAELTPQIIGNNGIVHADGALLVGQYAPARLLRVPLDAPETVEEVVLTGDSIGSLPNGADGITWQDDTLVIAANRRLARLTSDDGWQTATVAATDLDVGVAAVTVAEDRRYGLKGEVVAFVLGTPTDRPFRILELPAP
ncbi:MAG: hypothetical protein R3F61_13435 [Myxococcota bacterium]